MALNKEIWIDSIVGNLFADNSVLSRTTNHSEFVTNKTVHVPNAGSAPTIVVNRSTYPATATGRTDADLDYSIDEFTTNPVHIPDAEKTELSYNKRESVVASVRSALQDKVASTILGVYATGVATNNAIETATNNDFVAADVLELRKLFDAQNIPQEGRVLLLDSVMYNLLLGSLTENQANAFLATADASKGIVGKIYGFDVYERATIVETGNVGLAWHEGSVSVAQGETKLFESNADPSYYGDVISALVRAGGAIIRSDKAGVAKVTLRTA